MISLVQVLDESRWPILPILLNVFLFISCQHEIDENISKVNKQVEAQLAV